MIVRITSISDEHQQKLATSLNLEYNGFAASGSFNAEFNNATSEIQSHTEVAVWMTQSGGIGDQLAFTGPNATKILDRLAEFPTIVHGHPVGYEVELATYETIPLPAPPPLVKEAIELVLADCVQQKMGFLKAKPDLNLALGENGPLLFDGLPSNEELNRMLGQYRTALSALLSHAIQVSTGQMDPPQFFVANPAPPVISFKKKPLVPVPPHDQQQQPLTDTEREARRWRLEAMVQDQTPLSGFER